MSRKGNLQDEPLTYNTGVVFKIKENTIFTPPRFALAYNYCGMDCRKVYPSQLISKIPSIVQLQISLPFFLKSGFPFLTVARTISPAAAAGSLLRRDPVRQTAITYRSEETESS